MPIPVKKSAEFKKTEQFLQTVQAGFRRAVKKAGVEDKFPIHETDKGRDLDHHTMSYLEVFALMMLHNRLPREFERIATCPICRYKRVDEVNYQATVQEVPVKTLVDLHPAFTEEDMRVHVNVCLTRVMKAAVGVLPSPSTEKQVKTFLTKLDDIDDDARELLKDAKGAGDFASAVKALDLRRNVVETYGKATGEYQDKVVQQGGPVTINQMLVEAAGQPKIKAIRLPSLPRLADPNVVDAEFEENTDE